MYEYNVAQVYHLFTRHIFQCLKYAKFWQYINLAWMYLFRWQTIRLKFLGFLCSINHLPNLMLSKLKPSDKSWIWTTSIMSQNISLGIDWNDFNKCWNDFHKKGIQLQLYNSDKTFLQPIVFLETAKTHNAAKMIWAGKNAHFCLKTFPHFFKRYPTNLIIVLHFECNMLWWTRDIRGAVNVWLAVIGHRNSSLD